MDDYRRISQYKYNATITFVISSSQVNVLTDNDSSVSTATTLLNRKYSIGNNTQKSKYHVTPLP